MIEYLTSFYSISFITTIIGLAIIYLYDRFEKKQYTGANYFRFAIVLYVSCFTSLYLVNLIGSKISTDGSIIPNLFGGGSISNDIQPSISSMSEYSSKMHMEQFKTGVPTF